MSMNQYMHPRNIYKQPPNFKQLAVEYPDFRKHITQDITGKVSFDFKSLDALRTLSCTLLKKDFNLNLEIPLNKLIPTIPLRLNYILWLEDLLNLLPAEPETQIKGIDIGTGASCVYPLIAASKNKWSMLATDVDCESLKYAQKNVQENSLEDLISIVAVKGETLLQEALTLTPETPYDFCMCNPPFFASPQELHPFFKARKQNRAHPRNAFCASVDEVVIKGGEVDYISKLINESKILNTQIKICTTMIGHKSSLPPLKKLLREADVVSFKQTEFCQGHTTRWGLAWTYLNIDLRKIPGSLIAAKKNLPKPLLYEIPKIDESSYKMTDISAYLVQIFTELEIRHQEVKRVKNLMEFIITADSNTWSNQRRKRREKLRRDSTNCESGTLLIENNNSSTSSSSPEKSEIHQACDKLADIDFNRSPSRKRSCDDDGFYNAKKFKTNLGGVVVSKFYLKAQVRVVKIDDLIGLELVFIEGTGTKEALHQVLQFIKNRFVQKQVMME